MTATEFHPALSKSSLTSSVRQIIRKSVRQGVDLKTERLNRLLEIAYFGEARHKHPFASGFIKGVSPLDQFLGSTFDVEQLISRFGRKYKNVILPFFDFEPRNAGYTYEIGATKVYVLNSDALELLDNFWKSETPSEVSNGKNGPKLSTNDMPANGIQRTSYSQIQVPSFVPFEPHSLTEAIEQIERLRNTGVHRLRSVYRLRSLYKARKWIASFGGIPNLYADYRPGHAPESGSGRMFGVGECNLQTIKRSVRRELYKQTSWWDYDFVSCHPTIFNALARSMNCDTDWLEEYLERRAEIHMSYEDDNDIPATKMKRVFTGMLYGQKLSPYTGSSLMQEIGRSGVKALSEDPFYLVLREEIRRNSEQIVYAHMKSDCVVNAVGKIKEVSTVDGVKPTIPSLLSHILTGYEAWVLNHLLSKRTTVVVLMHDGWVDREAIDVSGIEREISNATADAFGCSINLRIKGSQFT